MRRLLRFRLWHLLLLTAVAAAVVWPVANIRRQLARERVALHEAQMMGASVEIGPPRYQLGKWFDKLIGGSAPAVVSLRFENQADPYAAWGPYGPGGSAVMLHEWTPENVARLGKSLVHLPAVETLSFRETTLLPGTLQQLVPPSRTLLYLNVEKTDVTAADVQAVLAGLPNLERLDLSSTDVTDATMGAVARLPQLKLLRLENTRVTDAGLAKLRGLAHLEVLDLGLTRVTPKSLPLLVEFGVSEQLLLPAPWPDEALRALQRGRAAQCEVRASAYQFLFRPDAKALVGAAPAEGKR